MAEVDRSLIVAVRTWRWLRLDGADRVTKRQHLDRIDQLLELRYALAQQSQPSVEELQVSP